MFTKRRSARGKGTHPESAGGCGQRQSAVHEDATERVTASKVQGVHA